MRTERPEVRLNPTTCAGALVSVAEVDNIASADPGPKILGFLSKCFKQVKRT
jgi:hypothetical protein